MKLPFPGIWGLLKIKNASHLDSFLSWRLFRSAWFHFFKWDSHIFCLESQNIFFCSIFFFLNNFLSFSFLTRKWRDWISFQEEDQTDEDDLHWRTDPDPTSKLPDRFKSRWARPGADRTGKLFLLTRRVSNMGNGTVQSHFIC